MADTILTIDPGTELSAYVLYNVADAEIVAMAHQANHAVLAMVEHLADKVRAADRVRIPLPETCIIEMPECYGNVLGETVLTTSFWVGRFFQAWLRSGMPSELMKRKDVTLQLCGKRNVGDSEVQYALRTRFNEPANNRLRPKGKLKGVSGDIWAALGVAVAWSEKQDLRSARPAAWRK